MIKPEFWSDEKLAKISLQARLTYLGMWSTSDDYGVTKGNAVWLRNNILPYDDITIETFSGWLAELEESGRIFPFLHNEEKYYHIPTFCDHQKISHPSKARNPVPPQGLTGHSGATPECLRSDSGVSPVETETETEVKLKLNMSSEPQAASKNVDNSGKDTKPVVILEGLFKELWKKRYWIDIPTWNYSKNRAMINRLLKSTDPDIVNAAKIVTYLIQDYFESNNPFYVKAKHSLDVFVKEFNTLYAAKYGPRDPMTSAEEGDHYKGHRRSSGGDPVPIDEIMKGIVRD